MRSDFSLFDTSWAQLGEIAAASVLVYGAIILVVRVAGSRMTSELNSFDWIINVMVGSIAASAVLIEDVSLTGALLAIAILAALQFVLTKLTQRSEQVAAVVKEEPVLLTHKGRYLEAAMRRTRISRSEIESVLRSNGMTSVDEANWVILETSGELTVIPRDDSLKLAEAEALRDVITPGLDAADTQSDR